MNEGERCFRILSLDGGGIRGLFSAAFLAHVEKHNASGKALVDHFDLIVGTSTGSIIALGLAAGHPASEVLSFYCQHGPTIFGGARWRKLWQLFHPKYGNARLGEAVRDVFGDKTLNDVQVPVCIPSYELVSGVPRVFKDDHHPALHWGGDQPIWKVVVASSAAPTYFPSFQLGQADNHIDGGIWANNPILVGITEAVKYFGQSLDNISVLSVGTGTRALRLAHGQTKSRGALGWGWAHGGPLLLNLVLAAQSQSAHGAATLLLPPDRYLRIDADLTDPIPLDSYAAAEHLIERGIQAGRTHLATIEQTFLS